MSAVQKKNIIQKIVTESFYPAMILAPLAFILGQFEFIMSISGLREAGSSQTENAKWMIGATAAIVIVMTGTAMLGKITLLNCLNISSILVFLVIVISMLV